MYFCKFSLFINILKANSIMISIGNKNGTHNIFKILEYLKDLFVKM